MPFFFNVLCIVQYSVFLNVCAFVPRVYFYFGFESVLLSRVNDSVMRKQLLSLLFFTFICIHTLLYPETVNSLFHVHVEFTRSLNHHLQ